MFRGLSALSCFALVAFVVTAFVSAGSETGFLNRKVTVGSVTYLYQVYVPANWNANQKWPVILFLHGAGERGSDGLIQTEVGIGGAIRRHLDWFPAVVVLPQCSKDSWWPLPAMQAQALEALEKSIQEFNGDRERVYLTGLSMGGYGTWAIAAQNSNKFAALAPICGGIRRPDELRSQPDVPAAQPDPYAETAKSIGKTPVWVFHGGADPVVPPSESKKMVEALKAAGGDVKYTEFEGVGHNSWDKAYGDPELAKWLLNQKLAK